MSSHRFVLHLFVSDILSLRYRDTHQIWISVRYDGWDLFSGVIILVLWRPGKVMSCLAYLTGGPSIIVSFFARIAILPGVNCKTYFTCCSWWIICVPTVWPLLVTSYHCYLEAWLWYLDHQHKKKIWSMNAKCFLVSYPNTVVWVTSWLFLASLSKWLGTCSPTLYALFCLFMGRLYYYLC
jgi:hypothetical protein